jgi:glyoxylase-like metal-dependent hydrolase (beta-lactamase superfamily II)
VKALLAVTLLLMTIAAAAQAEKQAEIRTKHVRGTVYMIEGAVDVIAVSVGADGVLMVDSGYPETLKDVRAEIAKLGSEPKLLLNTHWHHTFGNHGFREAVIIAQERVRERMVHGSMMGPRKIEPAPKEGWPTVTFEDELTVHFNGEDVRLIHLPRAHTDGDVLVIFSKSNVVLTGDIVVPHVGWVDYPAGGDVPGFLAALDRVVELVPRDALIIPGHGKIPGPAWTMTYAELTEFRQVMRDIVASVKDAVAAGKTLDEVVAAGVPSKWQKWVGELPPRMLLERVYEEAQQRRL